MSRDTPVVPRGSGEFLKDQSGNGIRQIMETMRECPKCDGTGEVRLARDNGKQYWISIATCDFCEGCGCVPKYKVA